jgi:hypothetical protein
MKRLYLGLILAPRKGNTEACTMRSKRRTVGTKGLVCDQQELAAETNLRNHPLALNFEFAISSQHLAGNGPRSSRLHHFPASSC